jgi:hypothetical protein
MPARLEPSELGGPVSRPFVFRISHKDWDRFERLAQASGMKRSTLARRAVLRLMDELEEEGASQAS